MENTRGASSITHGLKVYSGGKSMRAGIEKLAFDQRQQGFRQGVDYALRNLSLLERILGRRLKA